MTTSALTIFTKVASPVSAQACATALTFMDRAIDFISLNAGRSDDITADEAACGDVVDFDALDDFRFLDLNHWQPPDSLPRNTEELNDEGVKIRPEGLCMRKERVKSRRHRSTPEVWRKIPSA